MCLRVSIPREQLLLADVNDSGLPGSKCVDVVGLPLHIGSHSLRPIAWLLCLVWLCGHCFGRVAMPDPAGRRMAGDVTYICAAHYVVGSSAPQVYLTQRLASRPERSTERIHHTSIVSGAKQIVASGVPKQLGQDIFRTPPAASSLLQKSSFKHTY